MNYHNYAALIAANGPLYTHFLEGHSVDLIAIRTTEFRTRGNRNVVSP